MEKLIHDLARRVGKVDGYNVIAETGAAGLSLASIPSRRFFARITEQAPSGAPYGQDRYSFVELLSVRDVALLGTPVVVDRPDGMVGLYHSFPAIELNERTDVPIGTIVEMTIADAGDHAVFTLSAEAQEESGSGSGDESGSGSGEGCDDAYIIETEYRCEWVGEDRCAEVLESGSGAGPYEGNLNQYNRVVMLSIIGGCLVRDPGEWFFVRTIGCCDPSCACEEESGSGGGTVEVDCCLTPIPDTLFVTVIDKTGDCTCLKDNFQIVYNPGTSAWEGIGGVGCDVDDFTLICQGGGSSVNDFRFGSGVCVYAPDGGSASCDPFMLVFTDIDLTGCACGGTATFIITE